MTGKEKAFVNAYLVNGFNTTAAARTAGYSDPNANGRLVAVRPDVAAEIERRMAEFGMGANETLARTAAIARGDMTDFLSDSGTGLDLDKAREANLLGLVKSYSFSRKSGLKIELYDKQAALRDFGRHHKLFTDKVEHDFSKLSDEELIRLASGVAGGDGAPGTDTGGESAEAPG